ncbi:MAG: IS30 family transposase [Clostridia bacterium]
MINYCHLSYEDRKNIEDGLNNNKSINQISIELNRNHSTVLREIDRNKIFSQPTSFNTYRNNNFNKDLSCIKLLKSPYVCNGCKSRSGCRKERYTYYARKADDSYKELISECRKGIDLTPEQVYQINSIIKPLIKKGQTTNHLYINHPDILDFSKVSFYNYIHSGVFEFGPLDFPRIVKYKKRANSKRRTRKEREIRINRAYDDFVKYINENNDLNIVEMDTVMGKQNEPKCMLTFLWRKTRFMIIILLQSKTMQEVTKAFGYLQNIIPLNIYKNLFQVILTDNGSEFFDVNGIEFNHKTGELVSKLFYCDPNASRQKGMIEKNHEFIRYVLPKETSFEFLTKDKCNLLSNNINSLCRDSLNGKSPFEAMKFLCDEELLNQLDLYYIEPDKVQLNTKLLK